MIHFALRFLISGLFLTPLHAFAAPVPTSSAAWEEIRRDDVITVYKKEIEGSDILAVKGVATLDAPFSTVLNIVLDTTHRNEWMEQVEEVQIIREDSPTDKIAYWHLSPPWPIRDRDLVIHETVEVDYASKKFTLRMSSIEDPNQLPHSDRVRAELYDASFVATPVDDGAKTAMVAESHADPKGAIPKWVVNIYQRDMPTKTIRRLLARAAKISTNENPIARKILGH